jgi:hypothetical protein
MELIDIFTAAILMLSGIHLVAKAAARLQPWWTETFPEEKLSMQTRSDWYVFFHCADLIGREPQQEKPPVPRVSVAPTEKRKRQPLRMSLRADRR